MNHVSWIVFFFFAPILPDIVLTLGSAVLGIPPDPVTIIRLSKISYALILLIYCLFFSRRTRHVGLWAGFRIDQWFLFLPVWIIALFPLIEAGSEITLATLFWGIIIGATVGFGEEVTFRGFIPNEMRGCSRASTVFYSSLLFGMAHLIGLLSDKIDPRAVLLQAITATALGGLFMIVKLRTGSLWPSIVVHSFLDATALSITGINLEEALRFTPESLWFQGGVTATIMAWSWYIWPKSTDPLSSVER